MERASCQGRSTSNNLRDPRASKSWFWHQCNQNPNMKSTKCVVTGWVLPCWQRWARAPNGPIGLQSAIQLAHHMNFGAWGTDDAIGLSLSCEPLSNFPDYQRLTSVFGRIRWFDIQLRSEVWANICKHRRTAVSLLFAWKKSGKRKTDWETDRLTNTRLPWFHHTLYSWRLLESLGSSTRSSGHWNCDRNSFERLLKWLLKDSQI